MNLQRLKTQAILHFPFFGALLHNFNFHISDKVPTAGINERGDVYINEAFMDQHTEAEQLFIFCHEIMHGAFLHPARMGEMLREYRQVANIAGDFLVNAPLVEMGFSTPKGALIDKKYTPDKWSLEALTKELLKSSTKQYVSQMGSGIGEDLKPEEGEGDGAEGDKESKEQKVQSQKQFEQNIKQSLQSAIMAGKEQGSMSASLQRMIEELLKVKTNWRTELYDWFNVRIRGERSWHRPNKKHSYRHVYMPNKESVGCGHIGIAVDVSGSISDHDLQVFASELNYIFETCMPTKVTVVYFHDKVAKVEEFDELPIKLSSPGCGGTNFEAAFDYFNTKVEDLQGLVFMTDTYGTWPNEPTYPVVVLSTVENVQIPFGKLVYADMSKEC